MIDALTGASGPFVRMGEARVLVADDDPILREFAMVHLATPDVEIVAAADGVEALERLRADPFDIALIDLDMPRLDGFGAMEAIRADPKLRHLPVVVITGREDIAAIDRAFEVGATGFTVKPLNWRLLSHQIAYVLRNSRSEARVREAREAAERADALKTDILRLMRHEFNTPLNAILGFADLIAHHSPDETSRAHARRIEKAGLRFKRVHEDILDASRLFAGEAHPIRQVTGVASLLKDGARRALATAGSAEDLRLVDRTGDAEIECDAQMLGCALRNLIENALIHGSAPVSVTATIEADAMLRVTVRDAGAGFPFERLAALLTPFAQNDGPLARSGGGLGLGLATASRWLELHGGDLGVVEGGPGFAVAMRAPMTAI